ncbi:MAG: alpha/beta hydrolase [Opitutales bacterium]|nr:alpha/beta hydrolase [Opitutales bacterium]
MKNTPTFRWSCLAVSLLLVSLCAVSGQALESQPETFAGPPPSTLLPNHKVNPEILLWTNGAPGSEGKIEEARYRVVGNRLILSNIHKPSITVYLPPEEVATGAAVVVIPGGGFRSNWITHEGYRVADWLASHGIAAFVLKYRLERDLGSDYSTLEHSLADAQRAIRTVRSRASEWSVDPERVGVIGFSAGGVLSGLAATHFDKPVNNRIDTIDNQSAKPAFVGLVYGSPFGSSGSWNAEIRKDMPPVFLIAGGNDRIAEAYPEIYQQLRAVGVSAELHLYAGVGHGFGIQPKNSPAVAGWIDRFYEWLFTQGLL